MNKKILSFVMIGVFTIGLVAAISYYALFSATFTVLPAITLSGVCEDNLGDVYEGGIVIGSGCVLTNSAPTERDLTISNDAVEGIEVTYKGTLELTKKDTITWIPTEDKITINYTIIGDTFEVTEVPLEHTLVYYKDNIGYVYTGNVVTTINMNLPVIDDENAVNDSMLDYCNNGFNKNAKQCVGAKLWIVPSNAIISNVIDWGRANEFYFETALVQYNAKGEITLSPGASLTITPVYEIGVGVTGLQTITTTVA